MIIPLVEVVTFDVRIQIYTKLGVRDQGKKNGDDALWVLMADRLEIIACLTLLFNVISKEEPHILKQIGGNYKKCNC